MMVRSEIIIPPKTLQIKKQEMVISRSSSLVGSKDNNNNNQSFRIYYGDFSGAVPFIWESQPGTPKHVFHTSTLLPPLTPPPSYAATKKTSSKHSKSTHLLRTLFPRLVKHQKNNQQSPRTLSVSSSWSSLSTSSSLCANDHDNNKRFRSRFMSSGSSFDSFEDGDYDLYHVSTPCFGFGNRENGGALRSSTNSMKKAFLAIVGQGSKLRY